LHFTQHVKPQLFLLDYYLPDMNGIVLYDRLHVRKDLEAVPALMTGAYLEAAADDIKQRGLPALEKPFELDEFLSIIESIVAASSGVRRETSSLITSRRWGVQTGKPTCQPPCRCLH